MGFFESLWNMVIIPLLEFAWYLFLLLMMGAIGFAAPIGIIVGCWRSFVKEEEGAIVGSAVDFALSGFSYFGMVVWIVLFAAGEYLQDALQFMIWFNVIVWVGPFCWIIFQTVFYLIRLRHYLSLPNYAKAHTLPDGSLDWEAIRADVPPLSMDAPGTAWRADNYARRALESIHAMRSRAGLVRPGETVTSPGLHKVSPLKAATVAIRTYANYIVTAEQAEEKRIIDETLRSHGHDV